MSVKYVPFHQVPSRVEETHPEHADGHRLVSLTIDGRPVQAIAGITILQAAQAAGIDIPTLCSDEKLEAMGGCRLCIVEIEGEEKPLPSCSTRVAEGMVVQTNTERLRKLRRTTLELILSDHNAYCQPPCQVYCPTHIDIPGFLELNAAGKFREAAALLKQVLPFPYTLGLVCPRPCENVCRRQLVEEPIAICQSHQYHGERVIDDPPLPWPREAPTGRKVAVVGAGPAGLACAYYLALKGHSVKVFEALPKQGGMLRYGIPQYRLPKEMLDKELNCVWSLGVELECDAALGRDFTVDDLFARGYEAVFLGIGAHKSNELGLPGEDLPGTMTAVEFLRRVGLGEKVEVGPRVIVIGGGFTAFDAARTSRRLGATKVDVVYRRSRKEMGAHPTEVDDAEHEGIELHILAGPVRIVECEGRAVGVEFIRMELGEPDARGRRRPVPKPGSEFTIEADTIIAAIGQKPELDFLAKETGIQATKRGTIAAGDGNYMTDRPGVFAGGDATLGASTVIQSVACGKLAARGIDAYLRGEDMAEVDKRILAEEERPDLISIVPYKPLHDRVPMNFLPFEERKGNFKLVELGFSEEQAKEEAARCLQCVCPAASRCHLQRLSIEHGLTDNRFHGGEPRDFHDYVPDTSHSFILRDLNKCINCTQCVRICRDVIGPDCYGLMGRGFDTIVTTPFHASLNESNCVSCGACAETCPTGALMLRERVVERYELDISRCIFCGDCVEVCPHGALAETPVFEFANYDRFRPMKLAKEELAAAPEYERPKVKPAKVSREELKPVIYPKLPRNWRE
ncbi:MAG: FAD-dependent oxidoreductase [Dehalococcoidales bacterium]|nr:FAD-dependent oxidoreductase [Dehalococcoidales bacterium]